MVVLTGEIFVEMLGRNPIDHATLNYVGALRGAALDAATTLARVGVPTRFVGEVGQDFLGRWALARIAERRVETRFIREVPGIATPLCLVELDEQGEPRHSFYRSYGTSLFEPDSAAMARAKWFHFGSPSSFQPRNIPGIQKLLEIALEHDVPVSFDPNLHTPPDEAYWEQLRRYLPYISVLKASLDDARKLFPLARAEPQGLLERLVELGVPITVLTLGEQGAWAAFRTRVYRVPAVRVRVADTVGAGDAFTAGLIYSFLKQELTSRLELLAWDGAQLPVILAASCHLAAITCAVEGAYPPEGPLNAWWERFG
ncbi:MAG: PfkB family carbohydrate kinase [Meiothermus sp.]|uniref:carbohydrate kinase family protein n=1 Tax=Meiothermus sp. TaxID=1955249 RepID=UPI00260B568D|nr:PfkB family carbohydrate kinase [Meiothermus sp.]MCS7058576.1 PfkB family carbohydrate kinase [Meiothermus sp.]MCX7740512.1 PfkB family carbohydrate kinase [Meiothermus sp.]MDW8091498.1 PfkB family carbohydrate kinase [Meiothermus sp.]